MPKENKSTSRRNRRQCSEVDNETAASSVRDTSKPAINANRYSPFPRDLPRKDLNTEEENMMMPSIEVLQSVSGGIIESGIKYILFPLHLLRFCIFGTSMKPVESSKPECSSKRDEEEKKKRKEEAPRVKASEKSDRSKASDESAKKDAKEKKIRGKDESADEMVTAEEDFDSSGEQWSTANNTLTMNMSFEYDNPQTRELGEPMDVSMEEQPLSKSEQLQNNKENVPPKRNVVQQDSYSSVDEEIARIFQKQCTSSEDEFSSSFVKSSSFRRDKTRQNNFLYYKNNCNAPAVAYRSKSNAKEQKKKQSSDFSANSKRRKVSHEEEKNERKTGNKIREEKRSRHDTSGKQESRASRTPVKNKETKRKDVKFKEIATQTDSAFSDDDVEMTPVDCYKRAGRRLHFNLIKSKDAEQELNYVADNEDSNDGSSKVERKRISSCSTSSSSTDLGFDDCTLDVAVGRSRTNSLDNTNNRRAPSRPPPGFPTLPQNPPLVSYIGDGSKFLEATSTKQECPNCSIVPPAPSPMRHLYYDYPEFMDLPLNVGSSKILNDILRNNYYR